jgi:uncharacterized iron-regulated protein
MSSVFCFSFVSLVTFVLRLLTLILAATPLVAFAATPSTCLAPGSWYTLAEPSPKSVTAQAVLGEAARRDVVLLGEHHDNADHHRWQLQTLAALALLRPQIVVGFEAFPRRVQPVLDQWVAGRLTAKQFLERAEWEKVWNMAPELYMPLFEFARLNRIPMVALNVDRTLTAAIGKQGWDAVPAERREGVSRPAAPSSAYENQLFDVYKQHVAANKGTPARGDPGFRFFVESQTTWDRAMAEALASRMKSTTGTQPLVVGIMGAGHVRHGYGVIHQLRDLGVTNVGGLIPADADSDCSELKPGYADAVFAVPATLAEQAPPPRLGVRLEVAEGSVRVVDVEAGSLAEKTGVKAGDRIVSVAGSPASAVSNVVAAVRGALPGSWLPLQVRRGDSNIDLIVKFPPKS